MCGGSPMAAGPIGRPKPFARLSETTSPHVQVPSSDRSPGRSSDALSLEHRGNRRAGRKTAVRGYDLEASALGSTAGVSRVSVERLP